MKKVITADPPSLLQYFSKIWQYRALIWVFAMRDLKIKYAQTILGLSWSIIQPLTALGIFTFFFGYILQWKADNLPYPMYVLSGLLGWNFFNYIVSQGCFSVQDTGHLIRKIYFPKAVLPLSKVIVALVELIISLLLLLPLMLWYKKMISVYIVFIPLLIILNAAAALVIVFFVSAIAYRKRDVFHIVPFITGFGIWITPVFFTKSILPEAIQFLWYLNPMAGITELWRWCLFTGWRMDFNFIPSLITVIPLLIMSLMFYKRNENRFSDFA